jgi:hypothetical protein
MTAVARTPVLPEAVPVSRLSAHLRRPRPRTATSAIRRHRPLNRSRRTPASGGHRPVTGPAQGLVPRRNLPVADCGHLTVRDKAECRLNGHIVSLGPAAGSAAPNARAIRKSKTSAWACGVPDFNWLSYAKHTCESRCSRRLTRSRRASASPRARRGLWAVPVPQSQWATPP